MAEIFDSTDAVRTSNPLRHLQSVTFDGPFQLARGRSLTSITVAYETYGKLNAAADNAVLVCHAISGDSHVASHDEHDDPGWWEQMVGPGRYIDTNRFFVVCPNILGGCRGTTGPGSIDPETGEPFGPNFPVITISDMVDAQRLLMQHLGIDRWRAVVGGSLGGHQAMCWATRYLDRLDTCMAIATSPRLSNQALAFDVIARNAISSDPHFHGGRYYDQPSEPDTGLAIARMLGHITYLSSQAMDQKFEPDRHTPRDMETAFEKRFSVGSYLAHQGHKFTERFDANSYLTISMAMDLFDLGRTDEQLKQRFADVQCDFLVVSFSSDWLFPSSQSQQIVKALTALQRSVTYCEITTDAGHDGFLVDQDVAKYGDLVRAKLGDVQQVTVSPRQEDQRIVELIEPHASVLDLGCGEGDLLEALKQRGHTDLCGVEVVQSRIIATARRGIDVLDYDLNLGLPPFNDQRFDYVVMSATLQAVENVEALIKDMLRVGRRAIVSFPNYGFREFRRMLAEQGRTPRGGHFPYHWYNTPNRRFPTIHDWRDFCAERGIVTHRELFFDTTRDQLVEQNPNLDADLAIVVISAGK